MTTSNYIHTDYPRSSNKLSLKAVSSKLLNDLKVYASNNNYTIQSYQLVVTDEPSLPTRDRITLTAQLTQVP